MVEPVMCNIVLICELTLTRGSHEFRIGIHGNKAHQQFVELL